MAGGPQGGDDKRDQRRVDVAVAGKFPQGQRMPGIDGDPLGRQPGRGQQAHQQHERDDLEADHRRLHRRHRGADPRDGQENRLRHRRVDRDARFAPD